MSGLSCKEVAELMISDVRGFTKDELAIDLFIARTQASLDILRDIKKAAEPKLKESGEGCCLCGDLILGPVYYAPGDEKRKPLCFTCYNQSEPGWCNDG